MAETEKILIEVEIDNEAAKKDAALLTGRLEAQRQALKKLKKELADSKGKDKEKAAAVAGLSRSIKDNTDKLRQNQKEVKANDNSINSLRASVSRLTAERNNLNTATTAGSKRFKELTGTIRGQTDKLKELEKAAGDTRRNVGNYTESIIEASGASGLFGGAIGQLKGGFAALKVGLTSLTLGFKGLRGAIIATGIGALILGLVSLIAFLKTTRKGVEFMEKSMTALGQVAGFVVEGFAKVGETIFDAFSNPVETLQALGDAIVENVINRFKAVNVLIEAVALAFQGEWSAALKKATDGALQLSTGVEDATDKIVDGAEAVVQFGVDLANTAEAGFKAGASAISLREEIDNLNLSIAKNNLEAQKQLAISADASQSNKDRIAAAEASIDAERKIAQIRIDIAKKQRQLLEIEIAGIGEADEEQRRKRKELEAQELQALATFETTTKRAVNRLNALKKQLAAEEQADARAAEEQAAEERQTWLDNRQAQQDSAIAKRKASEQAWSDFLAGQEADRVAIEKLAVQERLSNLQKISNSLASSQALFEETTAAFKAFAIVRASIDTYLAAANAMSSVPYPFNFVAAGSVIAAGLINVGKIAGFAGGGVVGSGVPVSRSNGDNRLITAKTGEVVLNSKQRSRIGDSNLAAAGVPGFATGGVVGANTGSIMQSSNINSTLDSQVQLQQGIADSLLNIPAPVLDYKEFTRFQNQVSLKESRANV